MTNSISTPKIVRTGEGHCLEIGAEARRQLLSERDTQGAFSLYRSRFDYGQGTPTQCHTREDRWLWVEKGAFDVSIGSRTLHLKFRDFAFVPGGTVFSWTATQGDSELLVGAMGRESAQLFRELETQNDNFPLDDTQKQQWATRYGIQFDHFEVLDAPRAEPLIVRDGEGDWVEAFGDSGLFLIASQHSGNRFCLGIGKTPSLSGPPLHVHGREDELFCILAGCYEFHLGDARLQAEAGDVVWAPRGVPHTFRVVSNSPGQCLTLCTPGGFDGFFQQCCTLFQSGQATPQIIAETALSHQIRFISPAG